MNEMVKMEPFEVNRRGFVSGVVAAAAGAAVGAPLGRDAASVRPFKVCVFTDIHFDDFWTNSDDTSFLDGIMARAEREKCDMMIHLGDFMHGVDKPRQRMFVERYNASRIPAYHVLGNHDQDQCDAQATLGRSRRVAFTRHRRTGGTGTADGALSDVRFGVPVSGWRVRTRDVVTRSAAHSGQDPAGRRLASAPFARRLTRMTSKSTSSASAKAAENPFLTKSRAPLFPDHVKLHFIPHGRHGFWYNVR